MEDDYDEETDGRTSSMMGNMDDDITEWEAVREHKKKRVYYFLTEDSVSSFHSETLVNDELPEFYDEQDNFMRKKGYVSSYLGSYQGSYVGSYLGSYLISAFHITSLYTGCLFICGHTWFWTCDYCHTMHQSWAWAGGPF